MIIFNNYATRFAQKVKDAETKKKEAASEASAGEETNESFLSILESIAPSTKEETRSLNELWRQLPGVEKDFLKTPNQANL
ncbi:MAG: DUF327 domain-containing protein, partial [Leptospiraceae bacterium]|nr:DUF327 domain-containing protein [Leptospiraceae bacterium]